MYCFLNSQLSTKHRSDCTPVIRALGAQSFAVLLMIVLEPWPLLSLGISQPPTPSMVSTVDGGTGWRYSTYLHSHDQAEEDQDLVQTHVRSHYEDQDHPLGNP